jgi:hypothetical protein
MNTSSYEGVNGPADVDISALAISDQGHESSKRLVMALTSADILLYFLQKNNEH